MQAPQISTLDSREDTGSPVPAQDAPPLPPAPTAAPSASLAKEPRQRAPAREVYVVDDEEDELIDDDDNNNNNNNAGSSSKPLPPPIPVARPQVAPEPPAAIPATVPVPTIGTPVPLEAIPNPSVVIPRKRAYRRRANLAAETSGAGTPTPSSPATLPGAEDETTPQKRRRVRSAPKATLEVKRQEPDVSGGQQDQGSLMMWRMNEAAEGQGVQHQQHAAPPPLQASSVAPPTEVRRGRRPKAAVAAGDLEGRPAATPPPRRGRAPKAAVHATSSLVQEEAQPSDGQYPSYGDQNYAPYLQQQPLVAVDTHYPILVDHVDKFHVGDDISPEDLPSSALRAAPSRPLPYATNAVQPPTTGLWSWHTGGLDKRRCRKWTKMNRTLTTIGGGTALVKAWIGDPHTEIDHIQQPRLIQPPMLVQQQPDQQPPTKASTPSSVSGKVPKPRKPRVSKRGDLTANGSAAGSAAATPPPPPPPPTLPSALTVAAPKPAGGMADAAEALEMSVT